MAAFVGLINAAWNLPEGEYQIRAVNQDGQIFLPAESQLSDGSLDWPAELQLADPAEDSQQAAAIRTLVAFLVQAEEAKLTALENSSDGFSALLFSTDPSQLELDELYDRYAAIGAQEAAVLDALELVFGSRLSEGRAPKVAAPARGLKDTLLGFFGYAGAAGERARDRILSDLQRCCPGIAENLADDLADKVSGEFSTSIAPAGEIVDRTVTQLFTDSRCTQYNSDPPPEIGPFGNLGPFTGTGTLSGMVSPSGEARATTDWQAGNAQVSGSWSGQGEGVP